MKKLKLVTAILLIAFVGCKKDESFIDNPSGIASSTMMGAQGAPSNNGVQLEFNDQQHFEDWLDYLENEIDQPTNTDDDSLLSVIETMELHNFLSLRNDVLVRNGLDDPDAEFTLEEIDNLLPCDLMGDDILKSTLNKWHEVIIGNMLYVYFPGSNIIGTDRNNHDGIAALREVSKCTSENELYKDFILDEDFDIFLSSSSRGGTRSGIAVECETHTSTSGVDYKIVITTPDRLNCNNYEYEFSVTVAKYNNGSGYYDPIDIGDFISGTVDFGDGSNSAFTNEATFNHTYLTTGLKGIVYTTTFLDVNGTSVTKHCNLEFNVTDLGCFIPSEFNYPNNKRSHTNNDFFMWYKAWANKIGTKDDNNYRIGSYTVGWKEKAGGTKWVRRRTMLETKIYGDEKNGSCTSTGQNINIWRHSILPRRKLSKRRKRSAISFQEGNYYSQHSLPNKNVHITEYFTPNCK